MRTHHPSQPRLSQGTNEGVAIATPLERSPWKDRVGPSLVWVSPFYRGSLSGRDDACAGTISASPSSDIQSSKRSSSMRLVTSAAPSRPMAFCFAPLSSALAHHPGWLPPRSLRGAKRARGATASWFSSVVSSIVGCFVGGVGLSFFGSFLNDRLASLQQKPTKLFSNHASGKPLGFSGTVLHREQVLCYLLSLDHGV
ncbi:hypothetical protein VTK73DRAFT_9135 [Phialemonium thermophilum]|uniref:Uncharacterized protein n=1 Tax=Phialemonium thermophilum TaxID=223376 RepID=A0ABR3XLH0_9PEZI